jgi:hypothetical protein
MEFVKQWPGVWTDGENAGQRVLAIAYRASNLYAVADDDASQYSFGPPSAFRLEDHRDGDALLRDLLPFPKTADFWYGCVREALLAAHWQATSGMWLGTANFSQGLYYVDNQQGETAIIAVSADSCHGVMHSGDPFREYDLPSHLAQVPDAFRPKLTELAEVFDHHFNQYCRPTGIFWAEGDRLAGTEDFPVLYAYGFETMQHEILPDDRWLETVVEEEADADAAHAMIEVAHQYVDASAAVVPSAEQVALIFPADAPGRAEAIAGVSDADTFIEIIKVVT